MFGRGQLGTGCPKEDNLKLLNQDRKIQGQEGDKRMSYNSLMKDRIINIIHFNSCLPIILN